MRKSIGDAEEMSGILRSRVRVQGRKARSIVDWSLGSISGVESGSQIHFESKALNDAQSSISLLLLSISQ